MSQSVKQALSKLIQRHREGVAELYRGYEINAPANPDTLMTAVLAYGQPFVDDLYQVQNSNAFDGSGEPSKSRFEQLIVAGLKVLKGVDAVANPDSQPGAPEEEEEQLIFGIDRTLFYILIGILVFVLLLVIFGN